MKTGCRRTDCPLQDARSDLALSADTGCAFQGQALATRRRYVCGKAFFRQGEHGEYLYFLRRGFVRFTTAIADGREQILRLGGPGCLLGAETLNADASPSTVTAVTPVSVCRIPVACMRRVLARHPAVSLRLVALLTRELAQTGTMLRNFGVMSARERIACFMLSLLPDTGQHGQEMTVPLSHKDIARMLGLRAETFSRELSGIKRMGLVRETNRRFFVADPDGLRTLVGLSAADSP